MAAVTICSDFGAPQNYVVGKEIHMYRALLCARNHLFDLKPEEEGLKVSLSGLGACFQPKKKEEEEESFVSFSPGLPKLQSPSSNIINKSPKEILPPLMSR